MLKSLNVAQSGLNAAKIAVENTSNNIANENTPGYKKRVVQLSELDLVDSTITGHGVRADETYRITSEYMFDNILKQSTKNDYYDEVSSLVGNIEIMFQETDTSGLSQDLNRYLQSVEDLRSNPNSEVYKNALKTEGTILVDSIQTLYSNIEAQEEITYNRLNDNVEDINSILKEIGELNERMGQSNSVANDLLDKRDQLETELASLIDIDVDRSNGDYQLKIGGSVAVRFSTNIRDVNLVEEKTAQLDRFLIVDNDQDNNVYDSLKYEKNDDGVTVSPRVFDTDDVVTYKFNNTYEVSVTFGESAQLEDGSTVTVDNTNFIRALEYKINHHSFISEKVEAFNGNYELDEDGNKIDTIGSDDFLVVESKIDGTDGSFDGRISITKNSGTTVDSRETIFKDDYQSVDSEDKVYLAVYDSEINVSSGIVKAQVENLSSDSVNNKIVDYKNKLDDLANALSDIYDKYVEESEDNYLFGHISTDGYSGSESDIKHVNLFSGSDVKSLIFNELSVDSLDQNDLDYLSLMQWKQDIDFDGFAQDGSSTSKTSFSEFYQELRVNISSDKENNDFLMETQTAVVESLQFSYDQLTKVDSDEEMINLIKFQAAYTANAKIITVVDEMLDTILNM